ncbi:hypothetical protein VTN00DRAFT_3726 [Thermoascus crustaceus]|uniref:uncharacterized protein n=1 Tax=Thermoascus crustaceus TaxID=5088 RepID=UPI00374387BF
MPITPSHCSVCGSHFYTIFPFISRDREKLDDTWAEKYQAIIFSVNDSRAPFVSGIDSMDGPKPEDEQLYGYAMHQKRWLLLEKVVGEIEDADLPHLITALKIIWNGEHADLLNNAISFPTDPTEIPHFHSMIQRCILPSGGSKSSSSSRVAVLCSGSSEFYVFFAHLASLSQKDTGRAVSNMISSMKLLVTHEKVSSNSVLSDWIVMFKSACKANAFTQSMHIPSVVEKVYFSFVGHPGNYLLLGIKVYPGAKFDQEGVRDVQLTYEGTSGSWITGYDKGSYSVGVLFNDQDLQGNNIICGALNTWNFVAMGCESRMEETGEIIAEVEVSCFHDSSRGYISQEWFTDQVLTVSIITNFGDRLDLGDEGHIRRKFHDVSTKTLRPRDGGVIIGFLAEFPSDAQWQDIKKSGMHFSEFGIIKAPCPSSLPFNRKDR